MCNSCWFFNFIFLKFRYNLFHVLVDSVGSAWSCRNFSTIFLTYLSCRESGLPITSSALYGGFIVTSLNTTMFDPFHITCENLRSFFYWQIHSITNWQPKWIFTNLINGFWNSHIQFLTIGANTSWNRRKPSFLLFTVVPYSCAQLVSIWN